MPNSGLRVTFPFDHINWCKQSPHRHENHCHPSPTKPRFQVRVLENISSVSTTSFPIQNPKLSQQLKTLVYLLPSPQALPPFSPTTTTPYPLPPPRNVKLSSSHPNRNPKFVVPQPQRNLPPCPRLVAFVSQPINLISHPSPTSPKCLPIWLHGQESCLLW